MKNPKYACKYSYSNRISDERSTAAFDRGSLLSRSNDMHPNSYVNTPSSSSTASSSTVNRSFQYRRSRDQHERHLNGRRHRCDRLFHQTHLLNRQYIIKMTNVLSRMQKQIDKLNRRTVHVETTLSKQIKSGLPIIRIPRLTRDEIFCITEDDNARPPTSFSAHERETDPYKSCFSPSMTDNECLEKPNIVERSTSIETNEQVDPAANGDRKPKIEIMKCPICQAIYKRKKSYLKHLRRIHGQTDSPVTTDDHWSEERNPRDRTMNPASEQSILYSDADNDSPRIIVNSWDQGEGRLRPRAASKANSRSKIKVKCDVCGKRFRNEYIEEHKHTAHSEQPASCTSELDKAVDSTVSLCAQMSEAPSIVVDPSPNSEADEPHSVATMAAMETEPLSPRDRAPSSASTDEIPTVFIVVTCLQKYQLDIVDQFVEKFSHRVVRTTTVDSRTTHLITNDDAQTLRSPPSLKFIEAIAHHCYCVSYRWLLGCLQYDRLVDEAPFEIEGDEFGAHAHGGPQRSRTIEQRHSLFDNVCFLIKCVEDEDSKISNNHLSALILACGGQIITCVTRPYLDRYKVIVLCDTHYVSERRPNYDECRALGIQFLSSNWVLQSILEYRQASVASYEERPL